MEIWVSLYCAKLLFLKSYAGVLIVTAIRRVLIRRDKTTCLLLKVSGQCLKLNNIQKRVLLRQSLVAKMREVILSGKKAGNANVILASRTVSSLVTLTTVVLLTPIGIILTIPTTTWGSALR